MTYTQLLKNANMRKVALSRKAFAAKFKGIARNALKQYHPEVNPRQALGNVVGDITDMTYKGPAENAALSFRGLPIKKRDFDWILSGKRFSDLPTWKMVDDQQNLALSNFDPTDVDTNGAYNPDVFRNYSPTSQLFQPGYKKWLQTKRIVNAMAKKYPNMTLKQLLPEQYVQGMSPQFLKQPINRLLGLFAKTDTIVPFKQVKRRQSIPGSRKKFLGIPLPIRAKGRQAIYTQDSMKPSEYFSPDSDYPFDNLAPFQDASYYPYRSTLTAWMQVQDLLKRGLPMLSRDRFSNQKLEPSFAEKALNQKMDSIRRDHIKELEKRYPGRLITDAKGSY